ncbi:MAG TPA: pilus assembly protein TadG-related protein [Micromonosporaceae bacterium]
MSALSSRAPLRDPEGWRPGRGGTLRWLRRDDRGAVATVFGILLTGGVLLGMLALVVDVGQLYAEREELQTGADAAALALAKQCAADPTACTVTDRVATATEYAAAKNARDGAAAVEVCGRVAGVFDLIDCTGSGMEMPDNLTRCLGDPPTGSRPYLEVRTRTELPDGRTLFPATFAQTLLGNGDYQGATIAACARVSWGAPKAGIAVTFSRCEWDAATNNGMDFPPAPPYPPNPLPDAGYEVVLKLHDSQSGSGCPAEPPGSDLPGGFGWLDDGSSDDCRTSTFDVEPGNAVSDACLSLLDSLTDSAATAQVLFVPIFDDVSGQGANGEYEINTMEAFVPTGYFFAAGQGKNKRSWLTNQHYCAGQERCIYGYFVNVRITGVEIGELETVGATVISLIG